MDAANQRVLTWNDNDIQDSVHGLKSLHFSDFEVVDLTPTVSDLSVHAGAAGTSVTVTGQNFSGAAGHLQVFFGSVAATSVTIVDDRHLTVVAPVGTGTVDVRVQSGVLAGNNSQNFKSPVFGYGTSAVSAGDVFRYAATATNAPPTVARPAVATPNPVTAKTATLSVLGADDGGESSLRYTWSSTGPSATTFSVNGTNAAKNTAATFTKAGSYTFTVTLTDSGGLTATSSIAVVVRQTLTTIIVTPAMATIAPRQQLQFTARAFDQFGIALTTQPSFTWSESGAGSISRSGLYTAPRSVGGPYTVTASVGGVKGTATLMVTRAFVRRMEFSTKSATRRSADRRWTLVEQAWLQIAASRRRIVIAERCVFLWCEALFRWRSSDRGGRHRACVMIDRIEPTVSIPFSVRR